MLWNDTLLHDLVREKLGDARLVVVSNRQPYSHVFSGAEVRCERPASGMVSALDPVLRACRGLWVAHGSGSADRVAVDQHDRVTVPPDNPQYTLKRVWLTKEEEAGYYYGFANEALWPLCHVVFARPRFLLSDWDAYVRVNAKFATAILREIQHDPAVVWIQDYHFALLPRMLKEARPDLLVAQFWHIPWPNPEAFRICPWKKDLLWGMLANDVLGFHIRYHCDNFLATVDRELEIRVDRERSSVFHHDGIETLVRPFPISTDFEGISLQVTEKEVQHEARRFQERYALHGHRVCLGVDRIDYTKGILERLRAVDRLLTKYPQYRRQLIFLQAGPESRIHIERYQTLNEEITRLIAEINWRHGDGDWRPIILLRENLSLPRVLALYTLADVGVISSLHDGMNLVAKEYVAAHQDGEGVLVLSRFTGAARELQQALLINPYDTEAFADTLAQALAMDPVERRARMAGLRETVANNNIYRWAGKVLSTLFALRSNVAPQGALGIQLHEHP
ncbi:MAG: trehalose-6-phosphate synthase [Deltaproteobacteria bacterium]|nr:trehalose-6-phosphate synthase [Deltaproteobacteria bacterium]